MTADDFKATLYRNLNIALLNKVELKLWLDSPGMPLKLDFKEELAKPCTALAKEWADADTLRSGSWKNWASHSDIADWGPLQLIVFLNKFLGFLPGMNVDTEKLAETVQNLGAS